MGGDMKGEGYPRRGGIIAAIAVLLIGILLLVLPSLLDLKGMDGGYAILLVGILVSLTGLFILPLMVKRQREYRSLLSGADLIAAWTYTREEWAQANKSRMDEMRVRNRALLIIMDGMLLFAALVFLIWNPEGAGLGVAAILAGIGVILALAALGMPYLLAYHSRRHPRSVYIGKDGLVYGRELHVWKGVLARLESISYEGDRDMLTVVYSTMSHKTLRQPYPVYIPVPRDAVQQAKRVEDILGALSRMAKKRSS